MKEAVLFFDKTWIMVSEQVVGQVDQPDYLGRPVDLFVQKLYPFISHKNIINYLYINFLNYTTPLKAIETIKSSSTPLIVLLILYIST